MEKYFTAARSTETEIVIHRSRFIGFARSVISEEDALNFVGEICKKHSLATHNCYAYICDKGKIKRFSDDGEPSGTAGKPILDCITNNNLLETCVVVVRYFGGTKLGAGGLVRAYSACASECIKEAGRIEKLLCLVFKLTVEYERLTQFQKILTDFFGKIISIEYNQAVEILFCVGKNLKNDFEIALCELEAKVIVLEAIEEKYIG